MKCGSCGADVLVVVWKGDGLGVCEPCDEAKDTADLIPLSRKVSDEDTDEVKIVDVAVKRPIEHIKMTASFVNGPEIPDEEIARELDAEEMEYIAKATGEIPISEEQVIARRLSANAYQLEHEDGSIVGVFRGSGVDAEEIVDNLVHETATEPAQPAVEIVKMDNGRYRIKKVSE